MGGLADESGRARDCDSPAGSDVGAGGGADCRGTGGEAGGSATLPASGEGEARPGFGIPELSGVVAGPGTLPGPRASLATWALSVLFTGPAASGGSGWSVYRGLSLGGGRRSIKGEGAGR